MANLLRSPAVLITLLLTVYWIFGPTPTPHEKEPVADQPQDKLVLRVPPKEEEPDPPLPPAKKRRKGPRAAIHAKQSRQLTSTSKSDAQEDAATQPVRAKIRGITPLPGEDKRPAAPVQQREPRHVTHVIVDGDDLKRLATKYLGDSERSYEIFEANPKVLHRPDVLPVGKSIRIPMTDDR